jgi:hypothetical protein
MYLIIDAAANGDVKIVNPTEVQQAQFFRLRSFAKTELDR